MKRVGIFFYGVVCYAVFFATFLHAVGFIGNAWVPKSLDSHGDVPLGPALAIDLGLLARFAAHPEYADCRRRVPMLIPFFGRRA